MWELRGDLKLVIYLKLLLLNQDPLFIDLLLLLLNEILLQIIGSAHQRTALQSAFRCRTRVDQRIIRVVDASEQKRERYGSQPEKSHKRDGDVSTARSAGITQKRWVVTERKGAGEGANNEDDRNRDEKGRKILDEGLGARHAGVAESS